MARTSTSTKKRAGLTAQQRLFAHELAANGGNQTEAAISAGYSARSARNQGARLMANEDIRQLVADLTAKRLAKVDSKADAVLEELRHVGMARLSRIVTDDGKVRPMAEWGEDERAALSKLEVVQDHLLPIAGGRRQTDDGMDLEPPVAFTTSKVEMAGKLKALETLAKHHGLLKDVVEHRGTVLLVDPYAAPPAGAPAPKAEGGA